jgi:hypothetical protein
MGMFYSEKIILVSNFLEQLKGNNEKDYIDKFIIIKGWIKFQGHNNDLGDYVLIGTNTYNQNGNFVICPIKKEAADKDNKLKISTYVVVEGNIEQYNSTNNILMLKDCVIWASYRYEQLHPEIISGFNINGKELVNQRFPDNSNETNSIFVKKFLELFTVGMPDSKFFTIYHMDFDKSLSKSTKIFDHRKYPKEFPLAVYDATVITDVAIYNKKPFCNTIRIPFDEIIDIVCSSKTKSNIIIIDTTTDKDYEILGIDYISNISFVSDLKDAINAKRNYFHEIKEKI